MVRKNISRIVMVLFAISAGYFVFVILPYFVATFQYDSLISHKDLNKEKVEDILFLYSSRPISIEDSLWGKEYALKNDESCWQYNILWKEPIDVVYNNNSQVVKIFASFE